jgi:hypothetical protein
MTKDDTAVFHAFAWNPVKAEYDDWRGMGTPAAIAARSLEAQGPVHYCPKEWLQDGWLDKPKGPLIPTSVQAWQRRRRLVATGVASR